MNWDIDSKYFRVVFGLLACAELFSFLLYFFPSAQNAIFLILSAIIFWLSFKKPHLLFGIMLAELFIGAKGYLFFASFGDFKLPIRIVAWAALMLGWFVGQIMDLIEKKFDWKKSFFDYNSIFFRSRFLKYFVFLFVFIVLGALIGFINNDLVNWFGDLNAWLYFLIIFPVARLMNKENLKDWTAIFWASCLWLSVKTIILFYFFSHSFGYFLTDLYSWTRDNLLGEVTKLPSGFIRVFSQSQIFVVFAFFASFLLWLEKFSGVYATKNLIKSRNFLKTFFLSAIFLSAILISLSRSFWLGMVAGVFLVVAHLVFTKQFKKIIYSVGWGSVVITASALLIFSAMALPYPKQLYDTDVMSSFLNRVGEGSDEAAITSRWALLNPLWGEVKKYAVVGNGFGSTITYYSKDPRIVTQSGGSGEFTTYAFEWGWLDIWLKIGIAGLAVYLIFIFALARQGIKDFFTRNRAIYSYAQFFSACFLMMFVVHFFSPYFNHPLGIIIVVLASVIVDENQ